MIYLTLPELLHIAERALGGKPHVRDYGLLESAAARPRATAFGTDAYPDLDAKAAALPPSERCACRPVPRLLPTRSAARGR
jgi:death on curing protein